MISLPLLGAIVMPGNVTFLNQFFDARVIVANGAPGGSAVELRELEGVLRLPQGQVLRLARTEPPVAPGQAVPVTAANGLRVLSPGEQGAAAWTLEGLAAGTHVLRADITGEIARPGRDPLPVASTVQAAVDVVDARFHLTFTHPDVVREGEAYSLFVTVANLSRATQNLITVEIRDQHLVGAHREDPDDTLGRTITTLAPGQAETLEYRLVADLTGQVVAATFESSAPTGQGSIRLITGVGELGIPLSPATLVMPRFADRLAPPHTASDGFLRAWTRFLGLAYSLAVAPAGAAPELPRVVRADVEQRAVDVAEAGQRTFLGDGLLESLEVLALDLLGARHDLAELDALRRAHRQGPRRRGRARRPDPHRAAGPRPRRRRPDRPPRRHRRLRRALARRGGRPDHHLPRPGARGASHRRRRRHVPRLPRRPPRRAPHPAIRRGARDRPACLGRRHRRPRPRGPGRSRRDPAPRAPQPRRRPRRRPPRRGHPVAGRPAPGRLRPGHGAAAHRLRGDRRRRHLRRRPRLGQCPAPAPPRRARPHPGSTTSPCRPSA